MTSESGQPGCKLRPLVQSPELDTQLPVQTYIRAENALGRTEASTESAIDGTYTLSGLPPGTYTVIAGGSGDYVRQIWDGVSCPGSCPVGEEQPIAVANGQTVEPIDFTLERLARISGTVRDADTGAPLPFEPVQARSAFGFQKRSVSTIIQTAPGPREPSRRAPTTFEPAALPNTKTWSGTGGSAHFLGKIAPPWATRSRSSAPRP